MAQLYPTGNEYIAIPTIKSTDASIDSVNVVMEKLDGLLEIAGAEDKPFLSCDGAALSGNLSWELIEDWIPSFRTANGGEARGIVCAPPGQRFFIFRAPESGAGARFSINIGKIFQTINVRHPLPHWTCRVEPFNWSYTHGVVVDLFAGDLLLSIAFRCSGAASYQFGHNGNRRPMTDGARPVETSSSFSLEIEARDAPELLVGFGLSRVGARAADLEAHRVAPARWIERTEQWLAERRVTVEGDPALSRKANRNGHFARFFAMAKTLDTSRAVSMTSRSHRYYVSAAYWDRDSLLWLYPFLVRNDADHALELLKYAFGPQLLHAGIHSRQIGGQVLEYGFELDELCAPLLALGTWEKLHPDRSLWAEREFREGAKDLLRRLRRWRCEDAALYRTELMPTDDPLVENRDVLTTNNALAAQTLRLMLPFAEAHDQESAIWMREDADAIPAAIRDRLVRDGIFQWSVNSEGSAEFYDEAAGSLLLLPYYELCESSDPIYQKTVETLYSSDYPYRLPGAFSELGNRHTDGAPHPWVLSACSSALSGIRRREGLDFLRRAPMDSGIACESVNVESGLPESGEHFATCAGFVAHAIAYATGSYSQEIQERDAQPSQAGAGTL